MIQVNQGQRVVIPRDAITGFLSGVALPLVRGEDPRVESWQVTMSPVYRDAVGPSDVGMPGRVFPAIDDGDLLVTMTFGGGGVSFRHQFLYPVLGASFAVSGDNIQIDVQATDTLTPFAVANVPAVVAWVKPRATPSYPTPLVISAPIGALFGPQDIVPWCKALVVSGDTPAATLHVQIFSSPALVVVDVTVPANQITRIPIPSNGYRATVTPSAGLVSVLQELVFT